MFESSHTVTISEELKKKETVLPGLAIYRQIGDFGPLSGDRNFGLAIYRQVPNFGDFEP